MILVDPRVGRKGSQSAAERLIGIVRTLRQRVTCPVKPARRYLNSGDFAFEGNGPDGNIMIGIELKTVQDACASMRSDRLAGSQLQSMAQDYGMSFVIVQGLWRPGNGSVLMEYKGRGWKVLTLGSNTRQVFQYSELFKHLVSLSVLKNVIVLRSMTEDETLWMIAHLYQWWQKPWSDHRSADPIKIQTEVSFTRVSLLRKYASELPGVGWTRSAAVEKAFISVQQMVNASVEQWESIDGIGPKLAKTAWKALRERA